MDCIDKSLLYIKERWQIDRFFDLPNPEGWLKGIRECALSIPDTANSELDTDAEIEALHGTTSLPSGHDLFEFIVNGKGSVTVNMFFEWERVKHNWYGVPLDERQTLCRDMIKTAAQVVKLTKQPIVISL